MSLLTWDDTLALGLPRMDATHAEFVHLLGALETALQARAGIDAELAALIAHTVEHFAQEERWMAALGFAPQNCHAMQHASVLGVMREVQRVHAAEPDRSLVQRLAAELAQWFPVHAQMMDAALAQTMAERGYDPETGALAVPTAADAAPNTGCGSARCS